MMGLPEGDVVALPSFLAVPSTSDTSPPSSEQCQSSSVRVVSMSIQ